MAPCTAGSPAARADGTWLWVIDKFYRRLSRAGAGAEPGRRASGRRASSAGVRSDPRESNRWSAAMPKIDIAAVPQRKGAGYPPPFDAPCAERVRQRLGNAGGLTDFGVNLMRLPPGNWSSQRHWHSHEDEFVYVLEGELTLIEDGGETVLRAGDCAAFPKGSGNGHHLINRSGAMAVYLEVGSRAPADLTTCSDIDMMSANADGRFVHKDGTLSGNGDPAAARSVPAPCGRGSKQVRANSAKEPAVRD